MTDPEVLATFERLSLEGKVRLRALPEEEDYFSIYGVSPDSEEARDIQEQIERTGLWYLQAEVRCSHCGSWMIIDSIGMITGYDDPLDPSENPYALDLMRSAIKEV